MDAVMLEADPPQAAAPDSAVEDTALPTWAQRLNSEPGEIIPLGFQAKVRPVPGQGGGPMSDLPPKSGLLVINKPGGQTSHDIVQAVRRASGVKRVGHAGTLDPLATGVLVVALESATRVIPDLQDTWKGYRATVRLGASTTSYDRGERWSLLSTRRASRLRPSKLRSATSGGRSGKCRRWSRP